MSGMIPRLLAEAEAITRNVTEGPWTAEKSSYARRSGSSCSLLAKDGDILGLDQIDAPVVQYACDAAFIARSRSLVPELAGALALARDYIETLDAWEKSWGKNDVRIPLERKLRESFQALRQAVLPGEGLKEPVLARVALGEDQEAPSVE